MTMNNNQFDNQAAVSSQFYPDSAQEGKPRTRMRGRRRKNRGGQSRISGDKEEEAEPGAGDPPGEELWRQHKLESQRKDGLAAELGLNPRQVAVWLQNRRARYKSKKLEEEFSRLRAVHEETVVEKCRLEAELLKLKDHLAESEKEIRRFSKRLENRGQSDGPIS